MRNIEGQLEKLGLSAEEAAIYLFLLKEGGAFPSRISSECRINRSTVYKILTRLEIKGLVNEIIKNKKQFYQPEPPRKLKTQASYELQEAKKQMFRLHRLLPELEALALQSANKPLVKHYAGKRGVAHVYRDHIDVKRSYEMVAWANPERVREFISESFLRDYARKKHELRIKTRGIVPDSTQEKRYIEEVYRGITDPFLPRIKVVPESEFPFQAEITMYAHNKISFINLEEANPSATIIEDKAMHDMLRFAFELSWQGIENTQK